MKEELFTMMLHRPANLLLISIGVSNKEKPGYYLKHATMIDKLKEEMEKEDEALMRRFHLIP